MQASIKLSLLCSLLLLSTASCSLLSPSTLAGDHRLKPLQVPRLSNLPQLESHLAPLSLNRLRGGGASLDGLPVEPVDGLAAPPSGKVTLKFQINYKVDGGSIVAVGPANAFGNGDKHKAPKFGKKGGERWEGQTSVPVSEGVAKYQYIILANTHRYEARIAERSINVRGLPEGETVEVHDAFRSPKPATLATSCFQRAVFGKGLQDSFMDTENPVVNHDDITWTPKNAESGDVTVRFTLFCPRKDAGHSVWVEKGGKRLPMAHIGRGIYIGQTVVAKSAIPFEYKYTILDASGGVANSEGGNRKAHMDTDAKFLLIDEAYNYPNPTFKGAGMAIPVSGIKTRECTGIGEFLDLKLVADWCSKSGLQLIQILPINDSGEDPSPYSASSSFALHPIYVRPKAVAEYYSSKMGTDMKGALGWAQSLIDKLNGNWKIDYGKILDEKRKLMDSIYDTVSRQKIEGDKEMMEWVGKNKGWLEAYAAFKVQLNKERGFNNQWFDCTKWSKRASEAGAIVSPSGSDYDQVLRVYFTQYHLHLQLLEASKYAELKGVAIKGDLPIGVTRCSQDVWAEPGLFKLDRNAGAPGNPEQNWGFPPYNWDNMHRDGCSWWRRRLEHMEQYFHAYRIDHVLGFFRMWEIPQHGGGGQYVPGGGLRENGLKNLRAIQTASNMMICGEDLGNVPPEVGPVLLELGILGLKIQRWCNGKTWEYGYLTVAASSCHDCSPCRLWWNEDWGGAENFFNSFCGGGQTPGGPPDFISQKIIKMHAESSAMWTINPIQDYLDMWNSLRSANAKNDMINVPGSTDGCWIWRCHKRMEDLINEDKYNDFLKKTLRDAKRGVTY
mmetsp:Transcript_59783/g.140742  ORF Transcript_59783/g.140742 Transcript_59783/m.140742 type:complete len:838 (-) Transcript_59783:164-2677(-)